MESCAQLMDWGCSCLQSQPLARRLPNFGCPEIYLRGGVFSYVTEVLGYLKENSKPLETLTSPSIYMMGLKKKTKSVLVWEDARTRDWELVSHGSAEVRRAGVGRGGAQTGLTASPCDWNSVLSCCFSFLYCFN